MPQSITESGRKLAASLSLEGNGMERVCSALNRLAKEHATHCWALRKVPPKKKWQTNTEFKVWLIDRRNFHEAKIKALEKKIIKFRMILQANGVNVKEIRFTHTNRYSTVGLLWEEVGGVMGVGHPVGGHEPWR